MTEGEEQAVLSKVTELFERSKNMFNNDLDIKVCRAKKELEKVSDASFPPSFSSSFSHLFFRP